MKQLVLATKYGIDNIIHGVETEAINGNISQTEYIITPINKGRCKIKYNTQIKQLEDIISGAIANHIIDSYTYKIASKLIRSGSSELTKVEVNYIAEMAMADILTRKKIYANHLQKEVTAYIKNEAEINIDGYAAFRLSDFTGKVKQAADNMADIYINEIYDNTFVNNAIEFVNSHQSFCTEAHVAYEDNSYKILNDKSEDITASCYSGYEDMVQSGVLNKNELLLSSLLTLAPQKLVLQNVYQWPDSQLVKRISSIFGNNVITVSI